MKKAYQVPQIKDLQVAARTCGSGGCCSGSGGAEELESRV